MARTKDIAMYENFQKKRKTIISIKYQQQNIRTNIITKISFKKLHIVLSMQQTVSNYTIHKLQVCNAIKYQKSWEEKVFTKIPEKYEILLHPLEFIIFTLMYLATYIYMYIVWNSGFNPEIAAVFLLSLKHWYQQLYVLCSCISVRFLKWFVVSK